tara:strand:+ start:899 stop:1168 length:270 start_codon:yes stop_codon:yes gene_type:complete
MEDQEEKDGMNWVSTGIQFIVLVWSLAVISFSYYGNSPRQIDTTFAAGILSTVLGNFGLNIKKNGDKKKNNNAVKIVDNKDSKVGISNT